jgi:hypothetical protein
MADAPSGAPPTAPPPITNSELLHTTGASMHTPESFGRAIISAALTQAGETGGDGSLDRMVPATVKVRPVGGRTSVTDSPVLCIDVCVGIGPFEACIHVVVPEEVVAIFL